MRSPFMSRVQVSFAKIGLSQKKSKLEISAAIGAASDAKSVIGAGGYHTKKSRPGGLFDHPASFRPNYPAESRGPEGQPKHERQNAVRRRRLEADLLGRTHLRGEG